MALQYNWTDEYREMVEFYYWEPQMLGRSPKNPKMYKNADDMWQHLSKKEVPFNHILNIFFALFPLEKLPLGLSKNARALSSRENEAIYRQQNGLTQPDLFVVDDDEHVGIELKTTSKSSHEQVEKYVAFSRQLDATKPLRLVMLTPYDDEEHIFKGNVAGVDCSLEYVSFRDFYRQLNAITAENAVEQKLTQGVTGYMQEYFPQWV